MAKPHGWYWTDPGWGARFKEWLARRGVYQAEFAQQIKADPGEVSRNATGKGGLPTPIKIAKVTGLAPPHGVLNANQERILLALEELQTHLERIHGPDRDAVRGGLEAAVLVFEMHIRTMIAALPAPTTPRDGRLSRRRR